VRYFIKICNTLGFFCTIYNTSKDYKTIVELNNETYYCEAVEDVYFTLWDFGNVLVKNSNSLTYDVLYYYKQIFPKYTYSNFQAIIDNFNSKKTIALFYLFDYWKLLANLEILLSSAGDKYKNVKNFYAKLRIDLERVLLSVHIKVDNAEEIFEKSYYNILSSISEKTTKYDKVKKQLLDIMNLPIVDDYKIIQKKRTDILQIERTNNLLLINLTKSLENSK
jgi:hypothetical protein